MPQQNDTMDLETKVLNLKRRIREMKMSIAGELPDGRKEPQLEFPVQQQDNYTK